MTDIGKKELVIGMFLSDSDNILRNLTLFQMHRESLYILGDKFDHILKVFLLAWSSNLHFPEINFEFSL